MIGASESWELGIAVLALGLTQGSVAQPMYSTIPHHPAHPCDSFVLTKRNSDIVCLPAAPEAQWP